MSTHVADGGIIVKVERGLTLGVLDVIRRLMIRPGPDIRKALTVAIRRRADDVIAIGVEGGVLDVDIAIVEFGIVELGLVLAETIHEHGGARGGRDGGRVETSGTVAGTLVVVVGVCVAATLPPKDQGSGRGGEGDDGSTDDESGFYPRGGRRRSSRRGYAPVDRACIDGRNVNGRWRA